MARWRKRGNSRRADCGLVARTASAPRPTTTARQVHASRSATIMRVKFTAVGPPDGLECKYPTPPLRARVDYENHPATAVGTDMTTVLDKIVASKRQEVRETRARVALADLERKLCEAPPVRDFH